mmetsp:Transcript_37150/g.68271  ORF Transcript_37150/g.68271 Transcript_37150/m.68271 type:complete len:248 (+) Transcript_37150:822-1565(+)
MRSICEEFHWVWNKGAHRDGSFLNDSLYQWCQYHRWRLTLWRQSDCLPLKTRQTNHRHLQLPHLQRKVDAKSPEKHHPTQTTNHHQLRALYSRNYYYLLQLRPPQFSLLLLHPLTHRPLSLKTCTPQILQSISFHVELQCHGVHFLVAYAISAKSTPRNLHHLIARRTVLDRAVVTHQQGCCLHFPGYWCLHHYVVGTHQELTSSIHRRHHLLHPHYQLQCCPVQIDPAPPYPQHLHLHRSSQTSEV